MTQRYIYDLSLAARPRGAIGLGQQLTVPVFLNAERATFFQVMDGFHEQYPPCEVMFGHPGAVFTINGQETCGCGDKLFTAARLEDDDHARMHRLRGEQ